MSWSVLGHVLSERTIIGWLWWWPPCPLFSTTLTTSQPRQTYIGPPSEFISTLLTLENNHSYHCHCQPAPHTIHHSTPRAPPAPHMFHVAGLSHQTCTSSRGHEFWLPQGLPRIWSALFGIHRSTILLWNVPFTTICSPKYLLICLCLFLFKYSSCSM